MGTVLRCLPSLLRRRQGRQAAQAWLRGGTLFDTGTLFHSIQLYSVDPFEMSIASDVPYGVFHNEGTDVLPRREFMGFSKEDEDLAVRVLMKKLEEALQ